MAERHHYISKFYLKHFSPVGKRGLIWVYSDERPQLRSIEKHVASIENYYVIDTPEGHTNILEKKFGEIEARAGKVIKKISQYDFKLSKDELDILIVFMSYLRARIPSSRNSINYPVIQERKLLLKMIATHKDLFDREMGGILDDITQDEKITYEEFKNYVAKNIDKIDLQMSQNESIKTLLFTAGELYSMFSNMKWSFLIAPEDFYYITSDRPVFPFMNNWKMSYQPGFSFKDVEVYFPATPSICMMGTYHNINTEHTASADMVNIINSRIMNNCYRYLYSSMNELQFCSQTNITLDKSKSGKFKG